jgi:tRNA/rRNA methyltransferase
MPNLAIILVEPQGDANIGACCRAMKNFGFTDLRLVRPVDHLTSPAYTWAVDARDVLEAARIYDSLNDALADVGYAAAFTRRIGRVRKRQMLIADAAPIIAARSLDGGAAMVFGREDKGLSNAEIGRCDAIVEIPTSSKLPSLNLAQAVLLGCHEVRGAMDVSADMEKGILPRQEERFVARSEIAATLSRIDVMLAALGYEDNEGSPLRSKIVAQFEKIFGRAGLTPRDAGMIEGLVARVEDFVIN